jgi:hypothetical protein
MRGVGFPDLVFSRASENKSGSLYSYETPGGFTSVGIGLPSFVEEIVATREHSCGDTHHEKQCGRSREWSGGRFMVLEE